MNKIVASIVIMASACAFSAQKPVFSSGNGRTPDFSRYGTMGANLRFHRSETSTDYSVPGKVIHRYTDGSAVTNLIQIINAHVVSNSVEQKIAKLNERIEQAWSDYTNQVVKTQAYSNAMAVANGIAAAANARIQEEIDELREDESDLTAKIADVKYILLKPWLQTKLAVVQARIKRLENLTMAETR